MKFSAKSLVALRLCSATHLGSVRGIEPLVTQAGNTAALGQLANASEDQPPPCICKCGGKIQCEKG